MWRFFPTVLAGVQRTGVLGSAIAVLFLTVGPVRGQDQDISMVYMDAQLMPSTIWAEGEDWYTPTLMKRELIRQSVLFILREQYGMTTRDAALREPVPDDMAGPGCLRVYTEHVEKTRLTYRVWYGPDLLCEGVDERPHGGERRWLHLGRWYAQLQEQLTPKLAELGFTPAQPRVDLAGPGPDETTTALIKRMDLVSQYTAARRLHRAVDQAGVTRDRLVALVQVYANLSQLTAYHQDASRYVFSARAVLYANWLIELEPDKPIGYWARGYASAVMGRSGNAKRDFQHATERAGGQDVQPPQWAELALYATQYEFELLQEYATQDYAYKEAAALLWFRSCEFCGDNPLMLQTGWAVADLIPACTRIYPGMQFQNERMLGRTLGRRHREALDEHLPERLLDATRLDRELAVWLAGREAWAGSVQGRYDLGQHLVEQAGLDQDAAELSVAVLGRLIDAENVLQISQLVSSEAYYRRAPAYVDRLLAEYGGALEGHPHQRLIQAAAVRRYSPVQQFEEALDGYEPAAGHYLSVMRYFHDWMPKTIELTESMTLWDDRQRHYYTGDVRETDLLPVVINHGLAWVQVGYAKGMGVSQPFSPIRFSLLVAHDWQAQQGQAEQWEQLHARHPAFARTLAKRYMLEGRYEQAQRLYRHYLRATDNYDVYLELAGLYAVHMDDWDAVDALLVEAFDSGLTPTERIDLVWAAACQHFNDGNPDQAVALCERFVDPESRTALIVRMMAYEQTGSVDQARALADTLWRDHDQTYLIGQHARLGLDPALTREADRQLMLDRLGENHQGYQNHLSASAFYCGDFEVAKQRYAASYKESSRPSRGLFAASTALMAGDTQAYHRYVGQTADTVIQTLTPDQTVYVRFARVLREADQAGQLDSAAVEALYQNMYSYAVCDLAAVAGMWCEANDQPEQAIAFYRLAATHWSRYYPRALYACNRLRQMGVEVTDLSIRWPGLQRAATQPFD